MALAGVAPASESMHVCIRNTFLHVYDEECEQKVCRSLTLPMRRLVHDEESSSTEEGSGSVDSPRSPANVEVEASEAGSDSEEEEEPCYHVRTARHVKTFDPFESLVEEGPAQPREHLPVGRPAAWCIPQAQESRTVAPVIPQLVVAPQPTFVFLPALSAPALPVPVDAAAAAPSAWLAQPLPWAQAPATWSQETLPQVQEEEPVRPQPVERPQQPQPAPQAAERQAPRRGQRGVVSEEQRTTVMLRNLPNNYSRDLLMELLDSEGFAGQYDFIYMPMDFKSRAALGYAFLNMVTPELARRVRWHFDGFSRWSVPSSKHCHVGWSDSHQGLEANVGRYRNSPLFHPTVPDSWRPLVLSSGVPVPFPGNTKKIKQPRQGTQLLFV